MSLFYITEYNINKMNNKEIVEEELKELNIEFKQYYKEYLITRYNIIKYVLNITKYKFDDEYEIELKHNKSKYIIRIKENEIEEFIKINDKKYNKIDENINIKRLKKAEIMFFMILNEYDLKQKIRLIKNMIKQYTIQENSLNSFNPETV